MLPLHHWSIESAKIISFLNHAKLLMTFFKFFCSLSSILQIVKGLYCLLICENILLTKVRGIDFREFLDVFQIMIDYNAFLIHLRNFFMMDFLTFGKIFPKGSVKIDVCSKNGPEITEPTVK